MKNELMLNDLFWTLQGEGANWGRRALFVRMPYCNLKCSWCDTQFNSFIKWSEQDFIKYALSEKARFAVITGGEPMMNKQTPRIVELLKDYGFETACESNGTFPVVAGIDFVTISPKRDADYKIHDEAYSKASEFKYVVDEGFDFKILERHRNDLPSVRHSLSPEFGRFEKSVKQIIDFIKEEPQWRLSLQTHKWIKVP